MNQVGFGEVYSGYSAYSCPLFRGYNILTQARLAKTDDRLPVPKDTIKLLSLKIRFVNLEIFTKAFNYFQDSLGHM
jgi:hypothetical protein